MVKYILCVIYIYTHKSVHTYTYNYLCLLYNQKFEHWLEELLSIIVLISILIIKILVIYRWEKKHYNQRACRRFWAVGNILFHNLCDIKWLFTLQQLIKLYIYILYTFICESYFVIIKWKKMRMTKDKLEPDSLRRFSVKDSREMGWYLKE